MTSFTDFYATKLPEKSRKSSDWEGERGHIARAAGVETATQFDVLSSLPTDTDPNKTTVHDVAQLTGLPDEVVSRVLDELVSAGLAHRVTKAGSIGSSYSRFARTAKAEKVVRSAAARPRHRIAGL